MQILKKVLLCFAILGTGISYLVYFGRPAKVLQNQQQSETRPLVKTITVSSHNEPFVIEMDGNANSLRTTTVAAQVNGQIKRRPSNARSGMFVQEGDILFEVDDTNYRLELEHLEAQLNQTDEETASVEVDIINTSELITLAKEDARLQKKHLNRMTDAFARKSASETDVESALRQEISTRNALQTLLNTKRSGQQMLKQMAATRQLVTARIKQAQVNLERCRVQAPVSGTIVDDIAEQGDYIRDGDELVHISDSSQIEVRCSLQADDLVWVLRKASASAASTEAMLADPLANPIPCDVTYEFGGAEFLWQGSLSRFEGTGIDRDTRTFPCRVTVAEPDSYRVNKRQKRNLSIAPILSSGMFVTVKLPISGLGKLLRVPANAVRPGENVWAVRDGIMQVISVNILESTDDYMLIESDESGVRESDQLVISPLISARDGMEVREESLQ
ncbi:MAG: HlyD family efflux transporter periplasmic adaptor subunit [Fuerstiella sp.]|nr:HlyD family efflux transporter periplasmic adaptor subunit [Fuerstiella sp.]